MDAGNLGTAIGTFPVALLFAIIGFFLCKALPPFRNNLEVCYTVAGLFAFVPQFVAESASVAGMLATFVCVGALFWRFTLAKRQQRITSGNGTDTAPPIALSPPPIALSPPPIALGVRIGLIVRDVLIVYVLTYMGGFVVGVATGDGLQVDAQKAELALVAATILFGTVGFTIAGCLSPPGRWRHLGVVGVVCWLCSGLINVAFNIATVEESIYSGIVIPFLMLVGGSLSYVFKRDPKPSTLPCVTTDGRV